MSLVATPASLQALIDAVALPPGALVQQRIAKKLLAEQGAPTAADKRAIVEAIDELTWHVALKPGTVSVAATPEGALRPRTRSTPRSRGRRKPPFSPACRCTRWRMRTSQRSTREWPTASPRSRWRSSLAALPRHPTPWRRKRGATR